MIRMQQALSLGRDWKSQEMGIVACVYDLHTGNVLQTVALALQQEGNTR
jgi:hypothetical protein